MEVKGMNIFQKMLAITNEIGAVAKNLEVGIGKSQYKAVGEADVLKVVKELEHKYGIYSYPQSRNVIDTQILSTRKEYNGQVTEGNQIFMRIETEYAFVNVDNSNEYITITSYGDGIDTQDKAPGKAMTYSDKYALMKAYKIITGDDPDQEHSPDLMAIKNKNIDSIKVQSLIQAINKYGIQENDVKSVLEQFNYKGLNDIQTKDYKAICDKLEALKGA